MASQPARLTAPTSWEQVLDELEAETTMLAEGLSRGELLSPVTPWHPPALPPIPPELAARAQLLLSQQLQLQIELGMLLKDAPAAIRPRSTRRADPEPMMLDLTA